MCTCKHVNNIYLLHNLGKPNAQYEGQRRKKKSATNGQLLPGAQKFYSAGKL